jgi:hypothetical protein
MDAARRCEMYRGMDIYDEWWGGEERERERKRRERRGRGESVRKGKGRVRNI